MRILVTNDDGVRAAGIRALAEAASAFGDVKLVAPDRERSACSHAMTIREPLRARAVDLDGIEAYEVNGVPVDCVNIGLRIAWPDGCDLILSGFNHGPNLGFDVTYSGTAAGAMEGAINGIRSISLSMGMFTEDAPLHLATGAQWLTENWALLTESPSKPLTFLNVNIPAVEYIELRGQRITRMGKRVYEDRVDERLDPWGKPYFWQGGVTVLGDHEPGTDAYTVSQGFVSITPISLDWTDSELAKELASLLAIGSKS